MFRVSSNLGKREQERSHNPSRVRDHLANERTYLAWIRTSLGLMGIGILLARLRYLIPSLSPGTGHSWFLGLATSFLGMMTIVVCTHNYFSDQKSIDAISYVPVAKWIIFFSSFLLLIGSGLIYTILILPVLL